MYFLYYFWSYCHNINLHLKRKTRRILVLKTHWLWGKSRHITISRVSVQIENSSPTTAFVLYTGRMWAILIPCMNAYGILQPSFPGTTPFQLQHYSR